MIGDREALPPADGVDGSCPQAEVHLDNPMALRAGQVMVVVIALTEAEGVRAVGELDAVEHLQPYQRLDRPVHRCPADARAGTTELPQELLRGESLPRASEAYQLLRDGPPRGGLSFAESPECFVDPFLDVQAAVSALSPMITDLPRRARLRRLASTALK